MKALKLSKNKRSKGFSLMELMITVAIISIVAAVVFPSYKSSVKKSQRSDAQSALSDLANHMMLHRSSNGTYPNSIGTTGIAFPKYVPYGMKAADASYALSITKANDTEFTILATPVNGSIVKDDGKIRLDHLGQTYWDKNNNGSFEASENTWR